MKRAHLFGSTLRVTGEYASVIRTPALMTKQLSSLGSTHTLRATKCNNDGKRFSRGLKFKYETILACIFFTVAMWLQPSAVWRAPKHCHGRHMAMTPLLQAAAKKPKQNKFKIMNITKTFFWYFFLWKHDIKTQGST